MRRRFGTDGIRGVAGAPPLDPPGVRRFGAALAEVVGPAGGARRVVLGRDTRESGPGLAAAVAAGLAARGATPLDAGVVTTPGLAHIVAAEGLAAGVMISASHNPFGDNGLKVFGPDGLKLPDATEQRIEARLDDPALADPGPGAGRASDATALVARYVAHLEGMLDGPRALAGLRLGLDCAHGAASELAPQIFRHHGADVRVLGNRPDGRNINSGCGSLHLEQLSALVRQDGLDLGLAFDGDADRVLAVDGRGRPADGDLLLYLGARMLARAGGLRRSSVVATIMSNLWLEQRLAEEGITLLRAPVGDKYVLERMIAAGAVLGGEQSGHVIFRDHATTGDGILTGLLLLRALAEEGRPLAAFVESIVPCPQVLLNVRVKSKPDLASHPRLGEALGEAERALAGSGRVVLRYSGTEPLARVMVEGRDAALVQSTAERLAHLIEQELGC